MKPSHPPLRLALAVALLAAAGAVCAQTAPRSPPPPPPQLEPLPEIPPPGLAVDPELAPQVTITRKDGDTVEQARVNGKLVWVKVTPRNGRPYFLIPDGSGNVAIRRDGLDTGLRVPLWLLLEF